MRTWRTSDFDCKGAGNVDQFFADVPHRFGKERLFTVGATDFFRIRRLDDDDFTRQVLGQAFVTLFAFLAAVGGYQISFFDRFGKACGRVCRFGGIAKFNSQLIGVFDVAFASGGKAFFPKFEVLLCGVFDLRFQLLDHVVFSLKQFEQLVFRK
jgi:hypothetical protein